MPFDAADLDEDTKLLITARGLVERAWCRGIVLGPVRTPAWNDDPARTQVDVLAAYDRAIAR